MHNILVLGGYGFFGSRICRELISNTNIHLLIAGRDLKKAQALALELGLDFSQAIEIDATDTQLAQIFQSLNVNTVIHTAGPFQGQDYYVARAAIVAKANYIDLADGRDFVLGIEQLHQEACEQGVLVTSGASSLPALSYAVVDQYATRFSRLDSIEYGISSGARSPGLATMMGIFSYCGKPFLRLQQGHWETAYGWLNMRTYRFPDPIGLRWFGSGDVPDLVLFPRRFPSVKTVTFHAGFASAIGHWVVGLGALAVRLNILPSISSWAKPLHNLSQKLEPLISDKGGMFVTLAGNGVNGQSLTLTWHVIAKKNHGPYIPCGASIALAHKLANGHTLPCGAMPCVGILTVADYLEALKEFDVTEILPT